MFLCFLTVMNLYSVICCFFVILELLFQEKLKFLPRPARQTTAADKFNTNNINIPVQKNKGRYKIFQYRKK